MNRDTACAIPLIIYKESGGLLLFHIVSNTVPSADQGLTIVFGMGTGVSPKRINTGNMPITRFRFIHFAHRHISGVAVRTFKCAFGAVRPAAQLRILLRKTFAGYSQR